MCVVSLNRVDNGSFVFVSQIVYLKRNIVLYARSVWLVLEFAMSGAKDNSRPRAQAAALRYDLASNQLSELRRNKKNKFINCSIRQKKKRINWGKSSLEDPSHRNWSK